MINSSIQLDSGNASEAKAAAAQAAAAEQPSTKMRATYRVIEDGPLVTFNNGEVSVASSNMSSLNTSGAAPKAESGSVISTARSSSGAPLTGRQIGDNALINLGGMEVSIAAAARAGLIRQNENGLWEDVSGPFDDAAPSERQQHQQPAQEHGRAAQETEQSANDASTVETLDPASEQIMGEFVNGVGGMDVVAGAHEIVETGEASPEVLSRVASRMGVAPEQVAAKVETVKAAFEKQAREAVGANSEAVFDWARRHSPQELRDAMYRQVNEGSTKGYRALAQRYFLTLDQHAPDIILNSPGVAHAQPQREKDGSITILVNGRRMPWRAAVRAGMPVSFAR
ncbi:MAG TPA: hypothetical protein VKY65_14640 [Alphaproteobacteria bacterium]|nr:hypothetical protein [Alphaproteobacteria bacterium]